MTEDPICDDIARMAKKVDRDAGLLNKSVREKYWGECSIEDKISRMRAIVKTQHEQIEHLTNLVSGMVAKFEAHSHEAGRVMIPSTLGLEGSIGQFRTGKIGRPTEGDDCYF